ncbi:ABC transporter ATP-binding protein [Bradyrhizobium sp. WD16]|uniref:ABC transporter ATP-binding protein n=1 Tax=Bradyrhizobium sp. WD16 TaxID=1521768 RepID=UPI0020A42A7B|nr:ABC transporter ATP-binding protein [Bradyrhizobium sp. WD16]UTD29790.1 ABC transporter ATP-binding protein [Bradyrhizobium sp. WD16]
MEYEPWKRDTSEIVRLDEVCKSYNLGLPSEVEVLHDIDLGVARGEFVALIGPSGSGKSTLLNIIGLLDRPSRGRLLIDGRDTAALTEAQITHLRGRTLGFVFQYHHLISAFTAVENVMMPMLVDRGFPDRAIEQRAMDLMVQVGLEKVANNLATNMSGGQQQRVAVARALAMRPELVLADEPTGNLDSKSADGVFELMRQVNRQDGTSFLIVTHNMSLARRCDRIIEVIDGRIAAPSGAAGAPIQS